jgi:hypothetical protein
MPEKCPCETLWINKPSELFGTNVLVSDVCESNNINAFSRVFILGLLFSAVLAPFFGLGGFILVIFILLMLYGRWLFAKIVPEERSVILEKKQEFVSEEGFVGASINPNEKDPGAFPDAPTGISSPGVVTRPTPANPFMNVLLNEITYNPTRPSADFATDPNNQALLDDFFRVQWTSDPTDVFGKTQGQRQFYTMPSTSIPNDQGSYQNWLYLIPGKTCKEGGRSACYPATNGGPITWLNKPN